jgi:DNA helicase-2/ATP-dependent DNA helicase PcrA
MFVPSWTEQQTAIFESSGHLVVQARAGCGKSSTIVELAKRFAQTGQPSICAIAFNKTAAGDLRKKVREYKGRIDVRTINSLGDHTIRRNLSTAKFEPDKLLRLRDQNPRWSRVRGEDWQAVRRVVGLAKNRLVSSTDELYDLFDDVGACLNNMDQMDAAKLAQQIIAASLEDRSTFDFDDQVFWPNILKLPVGHFDLMIVDETQDTSPAQLRLVLPDGATDGRVVAVGDDRQSIYAFRGADSAAMDRVVRHLNAPVLPLSRSFRCARSIIRIARSFVPDIEAASDREGRVREDVSLRQAQKECDLGDFVISRTNRHAVSFCLKLLARHVPARILGKRDITPYLRAIVTRCNASSIEAFERKVGDWMDAEVRRREEEEKSTDTVVDAAKCIRLIARGCATVDEVRERMDALFCEEDPGRCVLLGTTHQMKGKEANRTWVLWDTYLRKRFDKKTQKWLPPSHEEHNLAYVAITRAQNEMTLVSPAANDDVEDDLAI